MFKNKCDFKSRFRILKGGKISLMVSALALGSIVNIAQADSAVILDTNDNYETTGDLTISDPAGGKGALYSNSYSTSEANITNNHIITIEDSNTNAYGISFLENSNAGNILNKGTLNVTGVSYAAYGIYTRSNSGIIQNTESSNINVQSTGTAKNVYGIYNSVENTGAIFNNGTISLLTSDTKDAIGIHSRSSSQNTNISNSGTINILDNTDSENPSVGADDATGIYINGINVGSTSNSGTINLIANNLAKGIAVGEDNNNLISNSGTINATSSTITATPNERDAYGISIADNNNSRIINEGTINLTSSSGIGLV